RRSWSGPGWSCGGWPASWGWPVRAAACGASSRPGRPHRRPAAEPRPSAGPGRPRWVAGVATEAALGNDPPAHRVTLMNDAGTRGAGTRRPGGSGRAQPSPGHPTGLAAGHPAAGHPARPALRGLPSADRCLVMGVVNVTPDSFSDGGSWFGADAAIARGLELAAQGADIVDVGGESTRPGAQRVGADEELRRVGPVISGLTLAGVPVSVDTMRAEVAQAALEV